MVNVDKFRISSENTIQLPYGYVVRNTNDGTLQVFAVSATNGELLYKKQAAAGSNTWIPYKSLGGNIKGDPAVVRNTNDGTLQVFAVSATNGELLYKKQAAA